jgi:hypothetical protein
MADNRAANDLPRRTIGNLAQLSRVCQLVIKWFPPFRNAWLDNVDVTVSRTHFKHFWEGCTNFICDFGGMDKDEVVLEDALAWMGVTTSMDDLHWRVNLRAGLMGSLADGMALTPHLSAVLKELSKYHTVCSDDIRLLFFESQEEVDSQKAVSDSNTIVIVAKNHTEEAFHRHLVFNVLLKEMEDDDTPICGFMNNDRSRWLLAKGPNAVGLRANHIGRRRFPLLNAVHRFLHDQGEDNDPIGIESMRVEVAKRLRAAAPRQPEAAYFFTYQQMIAAAQWVRDDRAFVDMDHGIIFPQHAPASQKYTLKIPPSVVDPTFDEHAIRETADGIAWVKENLTQPPRDPAAWAKQHLRKKPRRTQTV